MRSTQPGATGQADGAPPPPLWMLALITLSGTLAMHVFIPAVPAAGRDLGTTPSVIQLAISLYILGLAVGQLFYGPISDRYGRRPALIGGLVLYVVAGIAAGLATGPGGLIAARFAQALGGCAGLVLGRAIVRDVAGPQDTARRLALLNVAMILGPAAAPIVGALLSATFGWRSIFAFLSLLGFFLIMLAWRRLPETRPDNANPNLQALLRNYRGLIGSPSFIGLSIGGALSTTSTYALVAMAPFIFVEEFGRPVEDAAGYIAVTLIGSALGSLLTARLVRSFTPWAVVIGASMASVAAAGVFLALTLTHGLTVPVFVLTMFIYAFGCGTASPAALAQAVSVNPHVIGSASGLYGFFQMVCGAACTALAALGTWHTLSTALVLFSAGVIAQIAFWTTIRR